MTDFINRSGQRPKFLNLFKISMPITAIASILHRLSGFLLFLLLPLVIYGLGLSLKNTAGFQEIHNLLDASIFQLVLLLILSAFFYHLISGIRFLLMDLDIGHDLKIARGSAWLVIVLAVCLTIWLGIKVAIL